MSRSCRQFRALLAAHRPSMPPAQLWRFRRHALAQSALLVRVFYLCLFFNQLQLYPNWNYWLGLRDMRLLWPVAWFAWTRTRAGVAIVIMLGIGSALLAAAVPTSRLCRALATAGVVLFAAFFNSFGNVNHGWHTWLWISFVLIFLPEGPIEYIGARTIRAQHYLRVIWSAQAAKLMFYSMSGCWKLAAAAVQMAHGQVHALAPEALARQIAYHLLEGTALASYTLGPFVIRHPYAGWPFMLLAIYLETFSLLVAFRPAVHRTWGVALILFHLGVYLTMTIMFSWEILLVGLLLVCSPFAPARASWRDVVLQLPVIGDAIFLLRRRKVVTTCPAYGPLSPQPQDTPVPVAP